MQSTKYTKAFSNFSLDVFNKGPEVKLVIYDYADVFAYIFIGNNKIIIKEFMHKHYKRV